VRTEFFLCAGFLLVGLSPAAGQMGNAPAQIQRSQEILDKERGFQGRFLDKDERFVREVQVKGATQVSAERIDSLVMPFKEKWVDKKEFEQLAEDIRLLYIEEGLVSPDIEVSYEAAGEVLRILVKEGQATKND